MAESLIEFVVELKIVVKCRSDNTQPRVRRNNIPRYWLVDKCHGPRPRPHPHAMMNQVMDI